MSRLFNLFIGILIILFFVAVGWSFVKSSSFINEQAAKLKAGTNSLTENAGAVGQSITHNASAMGQSITEMPGKAKDLVEEGVEDLKEVASDVVGTEENDTDNKEAEAKKLAQEAAAKSAAADAKAAADKEAAFAASAEKEVPQAYDAASKKRLNGGSPNLPSAAKNPFMVITGSFGQTINAEKEVKKLTKMGYSAEAINLGTTKYLSVIAGRYQTLKEAQAIATQLQEQGIAETYVHKRKVRK